MSCRGDHCCVVGAELYGWHRQAGPDSHHLSGSFSEECVRCHPAGDDNLRVGMVFQGCVQLLQQRLDHRAFEAGRQVRLVLFGHGAAEVAQAVEKRRLQAAEAVLETWEGRFRERLPAGVAGPRQTVEGRPARVAETKHPGRLVECLAGRVVSSPADHLEAAGEAFDKAARMLGLGYPGGPALDLSLLHISEPTRLGMTSYAVFC